MRTFGRILLFGFAGIGVLGVLLVALAWIGIANLPDEAEEPLPDAMVLHYDMGLGLSEGEPIASFARFSERKPIPVRRFVESLEAAATDDRVKAMLIRLDGAPIGLARAQEARDAIRRFAATKPVVAFSTSLGGEVGSGMVMAYLASAASEVWLQQSGSVGITGFNAISPFLAETLERIGIEAAMFTRHEYKGAVSIFTDRRMTDPQRQNLEAMLSGIFGQVVSGIAEGRKLDPDTVKALIDRAPIRAGSALEAKLVDKVGYEDQVRAALFERAGTTRLFALARYASRLEHLEAQRREERGEDLSRIAVIHANGAIMPGERPRDPFSTEVGIYARDLARDIRDAVKDKAKAVVLRIDSPGGSYVASDTLWREVARLREDDKIPIIVSMGDVAASGGYFIAAPADRIVAQPGTITGSIGVAGGKFVARDLSDSLGVNWDGVRIGVHAGIYSPLRDFSPSERELLERQMDASYDDFVSKVAQGRKLSPEQVDQVARGRIFTGAQAKELGLVDELGGLDVAIRLAREALDRQPDQVAVLTYPRPKDPLEALLEMFSGAEDMEDVGSEIRLLTRTAKLLRPILEAAEGSEGLATRMPPIELR